MPIPQLTTFPDPPRIYQPEEEFDAKADEMAGHLPILVNEINSMVAGANSAWVDIDTKTSAATNAASTASNAATAATTSASNAESAKQAAASSANSAGNSASAALGFKNAAEVSAQQAATSASNAANASKLGLIVRSGVHRQLSIAAGTIIAGTGNTGDFATLARDAGVNGVAYMHLKINAGLASQSYRIVAYQILLDSYGSNRVIRTACSAYLYYGTILQQFAETSDIAPFFYVGSGNYYYLRIKLLSQYNEQFFFDASSSFPSESNVSSLGFAGGRITSTSVSTI